MTLQQIEKMLETLYIGWQESRYILDAIEQYGEEVRLSAIEEAEKDLTSNRRLICDCLEKECPRVKTIVESLNQLKK